LPADFYAGDEGLLPIIDMPGATEKDIDSSFKQGRLRVEGPGNKSETDRRSRRILRVPEGNKTSDIQATVSAGTLRLEIPRKEAFKKVRIPVKAP
jgi:HSP20 family molecular chaperone IbpA